MYQNLSNVAESNHENPYYVSWRFAGNEHDYCRKLWRVREKQKTVNLALKIHLWSRFFSQAFFSIVLVASGRSLSDNKGKTMSESVGRGGRTRFLYYLHHFEEDLVLLVYENAIKLLQIHTQYRTAPYIVNKWTFNEFLNETFVNSSGEFSILFGLVVETRVNITKLYLVRTWLANSSSFCNFFQKRIFYYLFSKWKISEHKISINDNEGISM